MQVSATGGAQVRWRADGRELYYLAIDSRRLMGVSVRTDAGRLEIDAATPLFVPDVGHVLNGGTNPEYVPSADGQRFLLNVVLQDPRPTPLRLVLNWVP